MPLTLDKVHEYQKIPGSQEVRLIRTQPYVRITHGGDPPIFIQGGQFYYQGGTPVTELPEWMTEEVAKLSPTIRAEVGLLDEEPVEVSENVKVGRDGSLKKVKLESEPWTCNESGCGKTMPKRGRTFHVLHHAKQAKRLAAQDPHTIGGA